MAVMEADANLREHGRALADAIDAAIAGWVARSVEARWRAWKGTEADHDLRATAEAAGERARADIGIALRALVDQDVDAQRVNPLAIVRRAVAYPTDVLRSTGMPPVVRDEFDERAFPEDVYGLTPATFADIDPALHEPGVVWGAAKAHAHLVRRRRG